MIHLLGLTNQAKNDKNWIWDLSGFAILRSLVNILFAQSISLSIFAKIKKNIGRQQLHPLSEKNITDKKEK
jgi:hypothetical protein